jgi:hypothetical protein
LEGVDLSRLESWDVFDLAAVLVMPEPIALRQNLFIHFFLPVI